MADTRRTSYAITVYPESCNWNLVRMYFAALHMPIAISPLHDCDVYTEIDVMEYERRVKDGQIDDNEDRPEVGKKKKPHYHVIFDFGKQKKSALQVLELVNEILGGSVHWAVPISNKAGYVRYLCHLDETEKVHYPVDECEALCGFDLSPLWSTTKAQQKASFKDICSICREYHVFNYSELFDLTIELDDPLMRDAVAENTYFFSQYCDGLQRRAIGKQPFAIDIAAVAADIRSKRRLEFDAEGVEV